MENTGPLLVIQVKQIKGTSVGKAIVELTGIEGAERDERQERLRKILHFLITYINEHPNRYTWKNAEVTVYDCEYNNVKFISGSAKYKFIAIEKIDGSISIAHIVHNRGQDFPKETFGFKFFRVLHILRSRLGSETKMIEPSNDSADQESSMTNM